MGTAESFISTINGLNLKKNLPRNKLLSREVFQQNQPIETLLNWDSTESSMQSKHILERSQIHQDISFQQLIFMTEQFENYPYENKICILNKIGHGTPQVSTKEGSHKIIQKNNELRSIRKLFSQNHSNEKQAIKFFFFCWTIDRTSNSKNNWFTQKE